MHLLGVIKSVDDVLTLSVCLIASRESLH